MINVIKFLLTILTLSASFSASSQWINEIHYDNAGGDVNEGIEVAGPAGTDLSCWQLVPYNGSGGVEYSVTNLSGTIPDEGCGYGAIWFPISGLQNGAPDGIALVDCGGVVIQFLSYEGTFTATSGPAIGQTSTDIGVSEPGAIGESLQLTGTGSSYGDFTWQAPIASSEGSLNPGQTISPCGVNTITTGGVTGAPFSVDCTNSTTDNGTVAFTSTGTFNAGNVFTAQLSDASGSFASPISIGTLSLSGVDPGGVISITIPAGMATGAGYVIRVVSDNPGTIGSSSAAFIINQLAPCSPSLPSSQGLLINEWSNGPSGSKEYYEFVVAGQCGDLVDIRGYILDDNNGTFSTVFPSTSGIAQGHLRLTNDAQWASIPVGSLIVIYNADDLNASLPPDDVDDTSPNDSLYVIPHNNTTLFEITTDLPDNNVPDSTYSPVVYASLSWAPLGLRNAGDAIQVRDPSGAYWHGVSYGGAEITGGPDNMKISTSSMGGSCGWFTDGDYLNAANWSTGATTGNETPGLPNNALNLAWLQAMRDTVSANCPITILPVEIVDFDGMKIKEGNLLHWSTVSEINADYFTLERSTDMKQWVEVSTLKAAGNSFSTLHYQVVDYNYRNAINYYRLKETDFDGTTARHHHIVTINNGEVEDKELEGIYNILGQPISSDTQGVQIHVYSDGTIKRIFK